MSDSFLPLRILIPGGSGQVGQMLARHFHERGHDVSVLARHPASMPWRTVLWNGRDLGEWAREIDGADVVINLAGRSVNCRYTDEHQQAIKESRVITTDLVGRAIASSAHPPRLWMNASTATIYRHALDRPMDEATGELGGNEPGAPSTWNFSIDVAKSWEQTFFAAPVRADVRRIAMRSAMVMDTAHGGIFDTLLMLVRRSLGGTAASGDQYVSWIHGTDFIRALEFLIAREELDGAINLSSPNPLPNRDFMRILREAYGTRIGLPAPEWMLVIGAFFLRTETELILKSRRVIPRRLLESGFNFEFPEWKDAARELVARGKR